MTDEYTSESTETEADWAYKWGQEARARQQLDLRLCSLVFDTGLFLDQVQKFLTKLEKNDDSHVKMLPKMIDQIMDLEDNLRNHFQRPLGCMAENTRIVELIKRQMDGISTNAEDQEVDKLIDDLLRTCNTQLLKEFRDWTEETGGQNANTRRENHRSNWVAKLPNLFGKCAIGNGAPDEIIQNVLKAIKKAMAEREAPGTKN